MNNNIVEIDLNVELADCELIDYFFRFKENKLTFKIQLWNMQVVEFYFSDPISFLDSGNYNVTTLCVNNSKTDLFMQALNKTYEKIPDQYPYKLFQFLDYDEPSFEIVAAEFTYHILK